MSESLQVAVVAGICNIMAVIVGRLLSRHEHKQTASDVRELKELMNGAPK